MKIHAVWKRDPGAWARGVEWFFLIFGLAALDAYIWINTTTVLYQAYQDWALDQSIRGQLPSIAGFAGDEIRVLADKERFKPEPVPVAARPARVVPSGVIGRLEIPNLHLVAMVHEGADSATLRKAVGHIPGTSLPGMKGNVGLAGHRDTFFRPLRHIQQGDTIELETGDRTYQYIVESTGIVRPDDVRVLAATNRETLTLVTCYPFYYVGSAPKRFIVQAELVSR